MKSSLTEIYEDGKGFIPDARLSRAKTIMSCANFTEGRT